jgi:uncharacterized protein YoxC
VVPAGVHPRNLLQDLNLRVAVALAVIILVLDLVSRDVNRELDSGSRAILVVTSMVELPVIVHRFREIIHCAPVVGDIIWVNAKQGVQCVSSVVCMATLGETVLSCFRERLQKEGRVPLEVIFGMLFNFG